MKKIAYIVPYFGKFPKSFAFWLLSCGGNPTIDWMIFTDDRTEYDYPDNVKVTYCTFAQIKERFQAHYDFPIFLDRPYKLCDFRPAYGEVFAQELQGYDYWGHCDVDLVWGNIRDYMTDELLEAYDKIGFNGHSTLYRNTKEVNERYRQPVDGKPLYQAVFAVDQGFAFDEVGMSRIYNELGIPMYRGIDFANLLKYDYGFFWKNGILTRHYICQGQLKTKEYMYLHYWCRPTTFSIEEYRPDKQYLIYADTTTDKYYEVTKKLVIRKSRRNPVRYYAKSIWFNRKKLTWKRILFNIKGKLNYSK